MHANVGERSIIPPAQMHGPEGYPLMGYFASEPRFATTMASDERDLSVRVLALHGSDGMHVLVNLDVLALKPASWQQVSTAICTELEIDRSRLLVTSTHTHCGPMLTGPLDNVAMTQEIDSETLDRVAVYEQWLLQQVIDFAVEVSHEYPIEVDVKVGWAHHNISEHRRPEVFEESDDPAIDDLVPVLSVSPKDSGAISAIVWGAACHPVSADNTLGSFSGDFPGHVSTRLRELYANCSVMFTPGALGDQDPATAYGHGPDGARAIAGDFCEKIVSVLNSEMTTVNSISSMAGNAKVIYHMPDRMEWLAHIDKLIADERPEAVPGRMNALVQQVKYHEVAEDALFTDEISIHSWYLNTGSADSQRGVIITGIGAEPVVSFAHRIREGTRSSSEQWIIGCANGTVGYLPDDTHLALGTYEAGWNVELPGGTRVPALATPNASTLAYGQPAPFAEGAQNTVLSEAISLGWSAREWTAISENFPST